MKATLPNLTERNGAAFCEAVRDALAADHMGRTSELAGGEIQGLVSPRDYPTGFWVKQTAEGLEIQVVIGGQTAGLKYRETADGREPINPETLYRPITDALALAGLEVTGVRCSGWQRMWDDDVTYTLTARS